MRLYLQLLQIELLLWPFLVDFGLEQSHRHNHAISRMKGKREHYILFAIDNGSLSLFASYGSLGHDCWHRSLLTGFTPNQTLQLCWKVSL